MNKTLGNILKGFAILFVAVHLGVILYLGATASGPLLHNDYALMIYQQHRAVEFFSAFHNMWGYDTGYSAGYPLNFTWNSNVILQFLSVLLQPVPEYIVLLATTVFSVAMAPFMFFFGLKNFGVVGAKRYLAMIVLTAYWWTGLPVTFMLLGMPAGLIVFHLSFYAVSLFYRLFDADDRRVLPQLYVLVPLCFLAHKTAFVILGVPFLLIILCQLRKLKIRYLVHLILIAALTLAVNSFWLIPFLDLVKFRVALAEAPHGLCYDPLRIFKDYFTLSKIMGHKVISGPESLVLTVPNTILRNFLLWFGMFGLYRMWQTGKRALASFFFFVVAVFMGEVYFGSFWWFTALFYPTRYIAYMDWFLVIPAMTGVAALSEMAAGRISAARKTVAATVAIAVLLAVSVMPYLIFTRLTDKRLDDDTRQLAQYLRDATTPNGRVMLEDSGWNDRDGRPPKYSESQFPSLLSDITGREFIGGPYPYLFLKHHHADFHDGVFLGKDIGSYSESELAAALDRYYIRWIVCWSDACKNTFGGTGNTGGDIGRRFVKQNVIGRFEVYKYADFNMNPFIEGDGFVVADRSGIRCYRVSASAAGRAVLKYHGFAPLVLGSGGRTSIADSDNDPIGFIAIKQPAAYFNVYNSYKLKSEGGITGVLDAGGDYRPTETNSK